MVAEYLRGHKGNQRGAEMNVPVWLYENAWYIAILTFFMAIQANAAADAIKFYSEDTPRLDRQWHWLKWAIDRPCHFLSGVFSFLVIEEIFFTDMWHLPAKFWAWSFGIVISLFSFKFALRQWEKYFKNEKG